LALVTDEMFGETQRPLSLQVEQGAHVEGEAEMQDVEHLGKYVYEMTKAKVEALKMNGGVMPTREITMGEAGVNGAGKEEDQDDEDDDRPENVLIPEEAPEGFDDDDDEDEPVV
jgi:intron-binding protein aquarius